jgi:hypothetical protein
MGYKGGRLRGFFSPGVKAANDRLARSVADNAGAFMTKQAQDRTPVRTGASRASIVQKPVRRRGTLYTSGAESSDPNVRRLEQGTAPHEIRPRRPGGALRFMDAGQATFAGRVNHPGTKGLHMFAIAAAETQREVPKLAATPLQKWKREAEAAVTKRGTTSQV